MLRSRADLRIDLSANQISGRVIFAPQSPVQVKDVIIDFLGLAKTWVDPAMPGTPRKRASVQFLKMNDDKDIREPKVASRTAPLELTFTFVVPRELLPIMCKCPSSEQKAEHLHLPPSLGGWANCDDMSADMSKIEYQIHVKVITTLDNRTSVVAEATEPVQILPVYSWWHRRQSQFSSQSSPTYEQVQSPLEESPEVPVSKVIETERVLKKGLFGKKKGKVSVSIEVPDSYYVNVGQRGTTCPNSLSMPVTMRYTPISADLPPNVSSLGARLQAHTYYNVDGRTNPGNAGTYHTSITILKTSTPSTSTPLWLEDDSSNQLSFVSNLLIPMTLPSAAGNTTEKGAKILLPSFESCLISRTYDIEIKIGFDGGNEILVRVPTQILAKPGTSEEEVAVETAIREADEWVPPDQVEATEVEPELMRPTLQNIRSGSRASIEGELVSQSENEEIEETVDGIEDNEEPIPVPLEDPPEYAQVVAPINKNGVIVQLTALAA